MMTELTVINGRDGQMIATEVDKAGSVMTRLRTIAVWIFAGFGCVVGYSALGVQVLTQYRPLGRFDFHWEPPDNVIPSINDPPRKDDRSEIVNAPRVQAIVSPRPLEAEAEPAPETPGKPQEQRFDRENAPKED